MNLQRSVTISMFHFRFLFHFAITFPRFFCLSSFVHDFFFTPHHLIVIIKYNYAHVIRVNYEIFFKTKSVCSCFDRIRFIDRINVHWIFFWFVEKFNVFDTIYVQRNVKTIEKKNSRVRPHSHQVMSAKLKQPFSNELIENFQSTIKSEKQKKNAARNSTPDEKFGERNLFKRLRFFVFGFFPFFSRRFSNCHDFVAMRNTSTG